MRLPAWARKEIAGVPAWAWALTLALMVAVVWWLRRRSGGESFAEEDAAFAAEDLADDAYSAGPIDAGGYGIPLGPAPATPGSPAGTPAAQVPRDVLARARRRARLTGRVREQGRVLSWVKRRRGRVRARAAEVRRGGVTRPERVRLERLEAREKRIGARVEKKTERIEELRTRRRSIPREGAA